MWVPDFYLLFFFNLWCRVENFLIKAKRIPNVPIKRERFPCFIWMSIPAPSLLAGAELPRAPGWVARVRKGVPGTKLDLGSRTRRTYVVNSTDRNTAILFIARMTRVNMNWELNYVPGTYFYWELLRDWGKAMCFLRLYHCFNSEQPL